MSAGPRWRIEVVDYDPTWPVLFGELGYTDAKKPYVWDLIRRADEWAQLQGWEPGPSDV